MGRLPNFVQPGCYHFATATCLIGDLLDVGRRCGWASQVHQKRGGAQVLDAFGFPVLPSRVHFATGGTDVDRVVSGIWGGILDLALLDATAPYMAVEGPLAWPVLVQPRLQDLELHAQSDEERASAWAELQRGAALVTTDTGPAADPVSSLSSADWISTRLVALFSVSSVDSSQGLYQPLTPPDPSGSPFSFQRNVGLPVPASPRCATSSPCSVLLDSHAGAPEAAASLAPRPGQLQPRWAPLASTLDLSSALQGSGLAVVRTSGLKPTAKEAQVWASSGDWYVGRAELAAIAFAATGKEHTARLGGHARAPKLWWGLRWSCSACAHTARAGPR